MSSNRPSSRQEATVSQRFAALALATLAAASLLAAIAALRAAPAVAGGGCPGAGGIPGEHSRGEMRKATICLLNRIRGAHGLRPLHSDGRLRKAAQRHATDMVRRDYFSHDTPGGGSIQTRIGGSGYLAGARSFLFGEVIGGGTARGGSPKAVARAWMHSPPHRAAILTGRFRDLGVGVVHGFPGMGSRGATFTVDFGARSR
jgi:uncharacterized protein YkwD